MERETESAMEGAMEGAAMESAMETTEDENERLGGATGPRRRLADGPPWSTDREPARGPRERSSSEAPPTGGEAAESLTEAVVILLTVVLFGIGWAHVELAGAAADAEHVSGYAAGLGAAAIPSCADGPEPVSTVSTGSSTGGWTGGTPR